MPERSRPEPGRIARVELDPARLVSRVVGVCVVVALLLFFLDFTINESRLVDSGPIRWRLMLVWAIALAGLAFGLDVIEGLQEDDPLNPYVRLGAVPAVESYAQQQFDESGFDAVLHFSKTSEEAIEIGGAALLWGALLLHLAGLADEFRIDVVGGRDGRIDESR